MPELTELVLTGVLGGAFGLFVVAALIRGALVWCESGRRVDADRTMAGEAGALGAEVEMLPEERPCGKVAVWFYRPWDLVGAGLVFGLFAAIALGSVRHSHASGPPMKLDTLLINMAFQVLLASGLAMTVVCRVGWVSWLGLRWRGWPWVFLIAPGSVLIMWEVMLYLEWCGYVTWMQSLGVETVQDTVKLLQKSEDPVILGLMAMAAMVAAPVCEEIVFRGYFYPVMKRFAGCWVAAVVSAMVFAAVHGNLTAVLPLFIFGGLLVAVYEKTGSLWAPIAVHCCFNSVTVIAQFAMRYFQNMIANLS